MQILLSPMKAVADPPPKTYVVLHGSFSPMAMSPNP